jgi:hypothetical protein
MARRDCELSQPPLLAREGQLVGSGGLLRRLVLVALNEEEHKLAMTLPADLGPAVSNT